MVKLSFVLLLSSFALLAQGPPPYRLPTTIVPQQWSGNGPPGAVPGNLPGDIYYDRTTHAPAIDEYFCGAPYRTGTVVTIAPACNAVADGNWTLTGGSGGGAPTGPAGGSLSGTYPNPGIASPCTGTGVCIGGNSAGQTALPNNTTATTQPVGANNTTLATSAAIVAAVKSLPPYLSIGGSLFIPADNMATATLPSLGSWTAISTQTGTVSSGTNGNYFYANSSGGTAYLAEPSHIASIESVFSLGALNPSLTIGGIFACDSTNSKTYTLVVQAINSGTTIVFETNTFSGGNCASIGNPSLSTAASFYAPLGVSHLKLTSAVGTLTSSYSIDGGVSFTGLGSGVAVGTIGKLGIFSQGANINVLSMAVN